MASCENHHKPRLLEAEYDCNRIIVYSTDTRRVGDLAVCRNQNVVWRLLPTGGWGNCRVLSEIDIQECLCINDWYDSNTYERDHVEYKIEKSCSGL